MRHVLVRQCKTMSHKDQNETSSYTVALSHKETSSYPYDVSHLLILMMSHKDKKMSHKDKTMSHKDKKMSGKDSYETLHPTQSIM